MPYRPPGAPATYRLIRRVGEGGFGDVYEAERELDGALDRVAVKLLHSSHGTDSQPARRLRDEARFLGQMDHPGIVRALDFVLLDGRPALITEFLDGADLSRVLDATSSMPLRPALQMAGKVAWALQSASSAASFGGETPLAIVHRDVKPANIHLGKRGLVKLLDFGVASGDETEKESETSSHSLLGTIRYLSPEALLRDRLTSQTDVWSLGATLYEAIHGEALWEHDDRRSYGRMVMQDRVAGAVLERIEQVQAPPGVCELLAEMLAPQPTDRPSLTDCMRRLRLLAGEVHGPDLDRWSSTFAWPPIVASPTAIDGKAFDAQPSPSLRDKQVLSTDDEPENVELKPPQGLRLKTQKATAPDSSDAPPEDEFDDDAPTNPGHGDFEDDVPTNATEAPSENATASDAPVGVPLSEGAPPAPSAPKPASSPRAAIALGALILVIASAAIYWGAQQMVPAGQQPDATRAETAAVPPSPEPRPSPAPPTEQRPAVPTDDAPPQPATTDRTPAPPQQPAPSPPAPAPEPTPSPAPAAPPAPVPVPAPPPAPTVTEAAPASTATRKVEFVSPDPLEITLDGVAYGPTPVSMELTLGRHQIQAKDPSTGEVIHGGDFDVAAGDKTLRINFRYSAEP